MRTKVHYKNKVWEVISKLQCNESGMERYRVLCGRTSMTCKVDSFSGQVTNESL